MDPQQFNEKLAQLMDEIKDLPVDEQARIRDLAAETKARQDKMRQTITELTDSLDYLRLSVKYLVFDLEATRRENKYLREMLETLTQGHCEEGEEDDEFEEEDEE